MYKKCIECPFHKVIDDPDIYDSWNADDEALVCTKIKRDPDPKSRYMVDRQPFKPVDVALRPYQTKNVEVPDWCPISTSVKRDEKIEKILNES